MEDQPNTHLGATIWPHVLVHLRMRVRSQITDDLRVSRGWRQYCHPCFNVDSHSNQQLTCVAVIPFFIASLTVSLSSLPTIKFGYLVRISMNKLRIAISSSFAITPRCSPQLAYLSRKSAESCTHRYKHKPCNWSRAPRIPFSSPTSLRHLRPSSSTHPRRKLVSRNRGWLISPSGRTEGVCLSVCPGVQRAARVRNESARLGTTLHIQLDGRSTQRLPVHLILSSA